MKKKFLSLAFASVLFVGCTHQTYGPARSISSVGDIKIELNAIYSMQRSYWSDSREGKDYFGKFSAFLVKNDMGQDGNARLLVYLEDSANPEQMNLLVDNDKFVWSGTVAGTGPSLSVNNKNSLVVEYGNDGPGRYVWKEKISAKILASSGKIEVIGYDYSSSDKLMKENSYTCSYNFLTGKATASTYNVKTKKEVPRKVQGVKRTVSLNDWTPESVPSDCIPK